MLTQFNMISVLQDFSMNTAIIYLTLISISLTTFVMRFSSNLNSNGQTKSHALAIMFIGMKNLPCAKLCEKLEFANLYLKTKFLNLLANYLPIQNAKLKNIKKNLKIHFDIIHYTAVALYSSTKACPKNYDLIKRH